MMSGLDDSHGERLAQALSERMPGTGAWLLDHTNFYNWLETPNSILWLHGKPGSGKTVLAATVIEHLKTTAKQGQGLNAAVAYFFFDYSKREKQTVDSFVSTVLVSLRAVRPDLLIPGTDGQPSADSLFDSLIEALRSFDRVYIVVDGLDECDVDERLSLFGLLDKLEVHRDEVDWRFFITSRLNNDILETMARHPRYFAVPIGEGEMSAELNLFIQSVAHEKPWLRSPEFGLLAKLSTSDNLMYAKELLQSVESSRNLGTYLSTELPPFTSDLPGAYRIRLATVDPESRLLVAVSLLWLAYSFEDLTLNELAAAIRLDPTLPEIPRTLSQISQLFKNLVVTRGGPGPSMVVGLVHSSLIDILRQCSDVEGLQEFGIDAHGAHVYLAEKCLKAIALYAYSSERTNTPEDFDRFPILQYACEYWLDHFGLSKLLGSSNTRLEQLAESIVGSKFVRNAWLAVHDPEDASRPSFTTPRKGTPPMHYAVLAYLPALVRNMIGEGHDAGAADINGRQALHVAVECFAEDRDDIVDLLLGEGVSPMAKDASGATPLLMAIDAYKLDLFQKLYNHYSASQKSQNIVPCDGASTLLHILAFDTTGSMFRTFDPLGAGSVAPANLNHRDAQGYRPLHRAVEAGNLAFIEALINAGADVNACDNKGNTPLHLAAQDDKESAKERLINLGADLMRMNDNNETPLQLAWKKKALPWTCYKVDPDRKTTTIGAQATCDVLRRPVPCGDGPSSPCRGNEEPCQCPEFIFRKKYELSRLPMADMAEVYRVQLRECRNLQRVDHPFIISYLGYEEFKSPASAVLYLEYCDGGDLGALHVLPEQPKPKAVAEDDDTYDGDDRHSPSSIGGFFTRFEVDADAFHTEVTPLCEADVWTLMYQLFLALAYLHYGVKVTRDGDCHCEPNWEPLIHRDVKPNNVVLSGDKKDGNRIAKLCDLGLSRDIRPNQTLPHGVGTQNYQPPELFSKGGKWTAKGDVWCLAKTIDVLYKYFTPGEAMRGILDRCQNENPALRPNSLRVVEEVHKHVGKPLLSLNTELGRSRGGFFMQAFLTIAQGLDMYTNFEPSKLSSTSSSAAGAATVAARPRKKLIKRLSLMLRDGADEPFEKTSTSLHLAVLLKKPDMLMRLLGKGQNPDEQWPKSRWTPLHLAAQEGQLDMVEELLLVTKTPDAKDRGHNTPRKYLELLAPGEKRDSMLRLFDQLVHGGVQMGEGEERKGDRHTSPRLHLAY